MQSESFFSGPTGPAGGGRCALSAWHQPFGFVAASFYGRATVAPLFCNPDDDSVDHFQASLDTSRDRADVRVRKSA